MTARSPARTYAEYVALERESAAKHEFVRGEVVAMAGGTPELAALQAAVVRALGNGLEGRPCRVFAADLRVRVEATDFACHPDATVVCHELERSPVDDDAVVNPTLVVEVLSDSTEAHDRGAKAAHYRRIPSLREYVLVSQEEPLVEVHRKNERGRWELAVEVGRGERVELAGLGVTLDVDALYVDPLAR